MPYVLSARLEVSGAGGFINDLDRATKAAKDASTAIGNLKNISLTLDVKGTKDFVADLERAEKAARTANETIEKMGTTDTKVEAKGVPEFVNDLEKAEKAARTANETIKGTGVIEAKVAAVGTEGFVNDMDRAGASARNTGEQIRTSTVGAGAGMDKLADDVRKTHEPFDTLLAKAKALFSYQAVLGIEMALREAAEQIIGFDRAITNALSISPESAVFRGEMEQTARTISKELGTPVNDVAEGFYFLASAGLNVEQQLRALPLVTRFAKAGMMDVGAATEVATQATAIFAKTNTMGEVLDAITQASIMSQGTIEQFSDSLTNRAGTAATTYSQTLEGTLGVLAAFAERGLSGKKAGEAYSIVLRDLSIKARINSEAFKEMGIEVFDVQGKMNPIAEITKQLGAAFEGLSDKQKSASLSELGFTLRSQGTVLQLIEAGGRVEYFTNRMGEMGGAVQRVADVQLTSLYEKLQILKAQSIDVALTGFEKLVEFAGWLKETFEPALLAIKPAAEAFVTGFGGVALALGTLIVKGAEETLQLIAAAIREIGEFAAKHEGAVTLLGAAIGALVTIQLASTIAGWGAALVAANMGGLIGAAVHQMGLLIAAMSAKNMAAAGSAFTNLVGLINPVTLAIGAIALTAGYVFQQVQENIKEAEADVETLLQAFLDLGVGIEDIGRSIGLLRDGVDPSTASFARLEEKAREAMAVLLTSELLDRGAAEPFAKLKLNVDDVALALSGGTDAFDKFGGRFGDFVGGLEALKVAAAGPAGPLKDLATQLLEAFKNGQITREEMIKLAGGFDASADAADNLFEKMAKVAQKEMEAALLTGELTTQGLANIGITDLQSASVDQLIEAYGRWKDTDFGAIFKDDEEAMGRFRDVGVQVGDMITNLLTGKGLPGAAESLNAMGGEAETAADKFDRLTAAVKGLVEGPLNELTASAKYQEAILGIQAAVKDTGFSLDATTESGRKTIGAFADLIQSSMDLAEAQAQGDPALYALKIDGMRDSLIQTLTPLLGNVEAATKLVDQYLKLPDEVQVVITAKDNMEKVEARLRAFLDDPNYLFTVQGQADLATAQADLGGFINVPYATIVAVSAETSAALTDINAVTGTPWATTIMTDADVAMALSDLSDVTSASRTATINTAVAGGGVADDYLSNWIARNRDASVLAIAFTSAAAAALDAVAATRYAAIIVNTYAGANVGGGGGNPYTLADGGMVEYYARGGTRERHVAQIASGNTRRVWAEPETGGEAYIPLALSKRKRSLDIWMATGKRLGAIENYANGGISQSAIRLTGSGGGINISVSAGAIRADVSAAIGANPDHLAALIGDAIKPALDEFALDLATSIKRRQAA